MKKQLLIVTMFVLLAGAKAQTYVSDMESLGLGTGQVYNGSTGGNGFQSGHAFFKTVWDTSFGGFWSSGWAASAVYDSSTAGFGNQYGCAAYKGYNHSSAFAVGTTGGNLTIRLTDSLMGKTASGFYVCNSTYAYKSMKYGDAFAKKFGGATGNDPDWFKLTVKRYYGGILQNDSVGVYLADFRYSNNAQDYILNNWTWINLSTLGLSDSLQFTLHSSDNGSFGMNTPAFFCLDDLTLSTVVGINELTDAAGWSLYPNPAVSETEVHFETHSSAYIQLQVMDLRGNVMMEQKMQSGTGVNKIKLNMADLPAGIYYVVLNKEGELLTRKIVKQ